MRRVGWMSLTALLACGWAAVCTGRCADGVKVTLRAATAVTAADVTLGDVAAIEGPADVKDKIAKVVLGPAPLPGEARAISAGYVKMRMRHGGVEMDNVVVEGEGITVSRAAEAGGDVARPGGDVARPGGAAFVTTRRGDAVDVIVKIGTIAIKATGKIVEETAGGGVMVRVDQTQAVLRAQMTGPAVCEVQL